MIHWASVYFGLVPDRERPWRFNVAYGPDAGELCIIDDEVLVAAVQSDRRLIGEHNARYGRICRHLAMKHDRRSHS